MGGGLVVEVVVEVEVEVEVEVVVGFEVRAVADVAVIDFGVVLVAVWRMVVVVVVVVVVDVVGGRNVDVVVDVVVGGVVNARSSGRELRVKTRTSNSKGLDHISR
jgi:hypothetical protein